MGPVYRFIVTVTVVWLLVLPIWLFGITPHYGHLLTSVANVLFRANVISGDQVEYEYVHPCVKGSIAFDVHERVAVRTGQGSLRFTMDGERFQFSLTVWTALLLATPFGTERWRKLLYFGLGLIVIFLVQEIDLFLQTAEEKLSFMESAEFLSQFEPASGYDRFMGFCGRYFLLIGYVAAPIALWIAVGPQRLRAMAAPASRAARAAPSQACAHDKH